MVKDVPGMASSWSWTWLGFVLDSWNILWETYGSVLWAGGAGLWWGSGGASLALTFPALCFRLFFRRHYPLNTVTFCDLDPQERK